MPRRITAEKALEMMGKVLAESDVKKFRKVRRWTLSIGWMSEEP